MEFQVISSPGFNVYRGIQRKHVESGGGCEREEGCVFEVHVHRHLLTQECNQNVRNGIH